MSVITKELALKIADKLRAVKNEKKNRPHVLYAFYYKGRLVCSFGVCRGSKKDKGHDHIPGSMNISKPDARLFARCDHSLEWYIEEMKRKGRIEEEEGV